MNENESLEILFSIEETVQVIKHQSAKCVALQFPDEMLNDADIVSSLLKLRLDNGVDVYILGDTSVCPCCVDTVALEHVNCDLVVHYGDACMSTVPDIPVYYVFERSELDIDSCVDYIRNRLIGTTKTIYLSYDLSFTYCIDHIYDSLKPNIPNMLLGIVPRSQNLADSRIFSPNSLKLGYHYFDCEKMDVDSEIVFIGKDELILTRYQQNSNMYAVLIDSGLPSALIYTNRELKLISPNRFLMQRYVNIERIQNVSMLGIIIGTLSIDKYRVMLNKLTDYAEANDQQVYPLLVGKMNLPKLANFPGIDGFVLMGCERSCFIDASDYPFPIVTPYEYVISIGERSWETIYLRDYRLLLTEEDVKDNRVNGIRVNESEENQIIVFESKVLDYINQKEYNGLDQSESVDTPAVLKKGQSGIASCYDNDLF